MLAQIRGLGSSASQSSLAPSEIARRSDTRSEHFKHDFRCAACSPLASLSSMSGRISWNSEQVMNPLSPIPFHCPPLRLDGLFGSARFQEFAQLHTCFMQLRLAVADRTTHHLGNLIMLEAFYIVQYENTPVARGKAIDSIFQLQPIDRAR